MIKDHANTIKAEIQRLIHDLSLWLILIPFIVVSLYICSSFAILWGSQDAQAFTLSLLKASYLTWPYSEIPPINVEAFIQDAFRERQRANNHGAPEPTIVDDVYWIPPTPVNRLASAATPTPEQQGPAATPSPNSTRTVPGLTVSPTITPTLGVYFTPTNTLEAQPVSTNTLIPPTITTSPLPPTLTLAPPTNTPISPAETASPIPPTATWTVSPVPTLTLAPPPTKSPTAGIPTKTFTPTQTLIPTRTNTPTPPAITLTPTQTLTPTVTNSPFPPTNTPGPTPTYAPIRPIVENDGQADSDGNGHCIAYFGYQNDNPFSLEIAYGDQNYLDMNPSAVVEPEVPTRFGVGRVYGVFKVTWGDGGSVTWNLASRSATVDWCNP
jgi:hypothetical protein